MNEKKTIMERISSKNIAFIGLIIIFFVLLLQSALSLFFELPFEELSQIDIIFRTSIISIFGYIMSMVSSKSLSVGEKKTKTKKNSTTQPKLIGFTKKEDKENLTMLYNKSDMGENDNFISGDNLLIDKSSEVNEALPENFRANAQIIVLTIACIFCLTIMLIARNFSYLIAANSTNSATFSLFRDIISGSIGALIGLSKNGN